MHTTEIAKTIRADLKASFPGINFSVRTKYFSQGSSISVDLKTSPVQIHNPERVAFETADPTEFTRLPILTPEADALLKAVNKVASRLHRDESDSRADYFNCNFYLHVNFDHELKIADRAAVMATLSAPTLTPAPLAKVFHLVTQTDAARAMMGC